MATMENRNKSSGMQESANSNEPSRDSTSVQKEVEPHTPSEDAVICENHHHVSSKYLNGANNFKQESDDNNMNEDIVRNDASDRRYLKRRLLDSPDDASDRSL